MFELILLMKSIKVKVIKQKLLQYDLYRNGLKIPYNYQMNLSSGWEWWAIYQECNSTPEMLNSIVDNLTILKTKMEMCTGLYLD